MQTIADLKLQGQIDALSKEINHRIWKITGCGFDAIKTNGKFCRLAEAIDVAENNLRRIREVFAELQSMEDGHK